MTGIFLSLSRVLPDRYPLAADLGDYVAAEHGLGHLLDVGVILPRASQLYSWSARELALPGLGRLIDDHRRAPTYAWDPQDNDVWDPPPSRLAHAMRRLAPARFDDANG
jgi:hypothetical protein